MKKTGCGQQNTIGQMLGALPDEGKAGVAFSLATVFPYVLVVIFSIMGIACGWFTEGVETQDWYLYVSYLLPQISFAVVAVAYFALSKRSVKTMIGKPKALDFVLAVCLQFGLLSLGLVNNWFIEWLNGFGLTVATPNIPSLDGFGLVGVLFVVAVLPAVFEEVLFRGIVLDGLKGFPVWAMALLCGGMFSLFHQNPAQTFYQFFCGVVFALVAIRSGSILPTVVAHFLNNAFIILSEKFAWNVYVLPVIIDSAVVLVLTLAYLMVDLFVGRKKSKGQKSSLGGKQFFMYASVGLVVCVIGWISGLFGA